MKILKFGGTSVGSADSIQTVLEIVKEQVQKNKKVAVVVSAFAGVTNKLLLLSELAQQRDPQYQLELEDLRSRHKEMIAQLMGKKAAHTEELIMPLMLELAEIIHGTYLLRECSLRSKDFILSFGERLSATIIASFFNMNKLPAEFCDARNLIITDDQYGGARINFEITNKNIRKLCSKSGKIQVVTGFIAATKKGVTTTLGRGGSDYTASVIASAVNASEIQIWTDVNGVLTTNPAQVKNAFSLPSLTYDEAMELSHFGAKVLHPPTIQPALEKNIAIRILNTFDRSFKGTVISSGKNKKQHPITGLTSIDNIALLTIQGSGMVGVPGIAARLFNALAQKEINIILITQASSEHSICVAVKPEYAQHAKKTIEAEFRHEISAHEMDHVKTESDLSVVAVVGQNMRRMPGIAGKLFNALGTTDINVVAVSQGSSELNISVVIHKKDQDKALNVIHHAFFENSANLLNIYLAGVGLVGSQLLRLISKNSDLPIRVCGILNSKKTHLDLNGIDLKNWQQHLQQSNSVTDFKALLKHISSNKKNAVFVDCTANQKVSDLYKKLLGEGISIVTANKIANSQSYKKYQSLHSTTQKNNTGFYYETNVGAALPVISSLKSIMASGDKIESIEAVVSGSLSYIFNSYKPGLKFKDIVTMAQEAGYTEPDPREDLSGMDVMRKILILARECGADLDLKDINKKEFLPGACLNSKNQKVFLVALEQHEEHFKNMLNTANSKKQVLRYIASYRKNRLEVGLKSIDEKHPFYNLTGTDNIVAIYSKRYKERPFVIKGPGAGAEITAGGVLSDILKLSSN